MESTETILPIAPHGLVKLSQRRFIVVRADGESCGDGSQRFRSPSFSRITDPTDYETAKKTRDQMNENWLKLKNGASVGSLLDVSKRTA